jgi:hypothetical protein
MNGGKIARFISSSLQVWMPSPVVLSFFAACTGLLTRMSCSAAPAVLGHGCAAI